jgi:hypothetical protein
MSHSLSENQNEKKNQETTHTNNKTLHTQTTNCFFKIRSALNKAATMWVKTTTLMILGRKRSYEQDAHHKTTHHTTHNHNSLFFPLERKQSTDVCQRQKSIFFQSKLIGIFDH